MLTHLTVHMTGPICRCDAPNLSWSFWADANKAITFTVSCKTCLTSFNHPYDTIVADFRLQTPYPEKEKSKPKIQDGECKIIELFPKDT